MASGLLLGALGGLGRGMMEVGDDILKRREQALDWAQREAMYQRQEADRRDDKQTDFENDKALTTIREDAANQRQDASIAAQNDRLNITQNREDARQKRTIQAQKDLAKLRGSIDRDNSEYSAKLKDQLSQDNVRGVQYGPPDKNGYAEVFVITNDAQVKPTGKKVFRPATTSQIYGDNQDDSL